MAEGKVVDGWYQTDNDINSVIDGVAGNGVITGLTQAEDSPADMSVVVAAGTYVANGTVVTIAEADVTIEAADGSNPRKDIIIGDSAGTLSVVKGTAATAVPSGQTGPNTSTPVPGNITANKIIICEVWVGTGVTTILDANITDRRILITKNIHMARAYLSGDELNLPDSKYARIEYDTDSGLGYDPGSNFSIAADLKTGTADAGTNATTLVDAAVSFGATNAAFLALGLFGAQITSATGGAHAAFIQGWTNEHELVIAMSEGIDFAEGHEYHINHAEYTVPVAGYYSLKVATQYKFGTVVADKRYRAGVVVNGAFRLDNIFQSSMTGNLSIPTVGDLHLALNDVVTVVAVSYAGVDTVDLAGGSNLTYFSIHLIQAD